MSFTKKIIVAMILGIITGVFLNIFSYDTSLSNFIVINFFNIVSDLFISALKLVIIPLIFFSIVCGIISLSDDTSLSRLGIKTLSLYLFTTIIAISLGLLFSSFIDYEPILLSNLETNVSIDNIKTESNIFPTNIFQSLSDGNIIHLLIFSVLIGIAASKVKDNAKTFINYFHEFNTVINELVKIIISFTPIAVYCILSKTFATQGLETLTPLIGLFFNSCFCSLNSLLYNFFFIIEDFYKPKSKEIFH
jgi:Na+/H+-dicarboxylate symporter